MLTDRDAFYALLDIEEPADFVYFENIAALFECEAEIEQGLLCALLAAVDKQTVAELIDNYFEELTGFLPDGETELFTLLTQIQQALRGMLQSGENDLVETEAQREDLLVRLAEEIERFRQWYSCEDRVSCMLLGEGEEERISLRDAIASVREEKLLGQRYVYDFSDCLDYPLAEYVMTFALADRTDDGED